MHVRIQTLKHRQRFAVVKESLWSHNYTLVVILEL